MQSLKLVQDEISGTLGLVDPDTLAELTDAFTDRTRRWFVSGQGRLLMLSASGETPVSVHLARRVGDQGARVLAITTRQDSSLAAIADVVVALPAYNTRQFDGSLFELASLVLLDALIIELAHADPHAYETMRQRHTNLESRQ